MTGDRLPSRLRARAARESAAQPPTPRCRCSHSRVQHGRQAGQCYGTLCGCRAWNPPDDGPQGAA